MINKQTKIIIHFIATIILTLGLSISLQSLLASWTAPTLAPPGGNTVEPLNVSSVSQAKMGGLAVGSFAVTGNSTLTGDVGVGNLPVAGLKLGVGGNIGAQKYCDENGGSCKTISDLIAGASLSPVPAGTISSFNLSACPMGWILADGTGGTPDLRGAFVRGMYGDQNGRDVARTLGNYQADELISHYHSLETSGRGASANFYGAYSADPAAFMFTNHNTGLFGGTETRPKNVALIYCMKTGIETPIVSLWNQTGSNLWYTAGNVGVGTNNPNYKLDVVGDINFTGTLRKNGTPITGASITNGGSVFMGYATAGVSVFTYTCTAGTVWTFYDTNRSVYNLCICRATNQMACFPG